MRSHAAWGASPPSNQAHDFVFPSHPVHYGPVDEDWLTVPAACALTGLSRATLHQWAAEGRLRTVRPRRILYVSRVDLTAATRDENPSGDAGGAAPRPAF